MNDRKVWPVALVLLAAAGTFALTMGARQSMGLFVSSINTSTGAIHRSRSKRGFLDRDRNDLAGRRCRRRRRRLQGARPQCLDASDGVWRTARCSSLPSVPSRW